MRHVVTVSLLKFFAMSIKGTNQMSNANITESSSNMNETSYHCKYMFTTEEKLYIQSCKYAVLMLLNKMNYCTLIGSEINDPRMLTQQMTE